MEYPKEGDVLSIEQAIKSLAENVDPLNVFVITGEITEEKEVPREEVIQMICSNEVFVGPEALRERQHAIGIRKDSSYLFFQTRGPGRKDVPT